MNKLSLTERFLVPPFSVFDARQKYWQERKRKWNELGIESHIGRNSDSIHIQDWCKEKTPQKVIYKGESSTINGTSTFDPVLCEIMYRWFCPREGSILDPFAGGSVRGLVAGKLGYKYIGVDIRDQQVEANKKQLEKILPENKNVCWILGDSRNLKNLISEKYDFIFSCPPYYNLEIYSDDKNDLCNSKNYNEFLEDYRDIVRQSVSKLKNNRFACFVVGDIRDDDGFYYNFVGDTINAFLSSGMKLYNEAILINILGNLPIRVGRQFDINRKLGKTHQNVLIFYNGNIEEIKNNFYKAEEIKRKSLFDT